MNSYYVRLLLFLAFFSGSKLYSQVTLSNSTVQNYVQTIVGQGVTFSNATLTGSQQAIRIFQNGVASGLGASMDGGIVLSTGSLANANALHGPSSTQSSANLGTPGDAHLDQVINGETNDAIILEFDFIPLTNTINVEYVFGSEEYNEYVGGTYNDAFGFFISGPGITGIQNIALVPGLSTPVSINSINNGSTNNGPCVNCSFFQNNTSGTYANIMDGFTVPLVAVATVVPCQTYHIRLVIADVADETYDSWVFIKQDGLNAIGNPPMEMAGVSPVGANVLAEGCANTQFVFSLPQALDFNYSFPVTWGGSATMGVDYGNLQNTYTFPAGQTEFIVAVDVFDDGIAEGLETIICTFPTSACLNGTITVSIQDLTPPIADAGVDLSLCDDGTTIFLGGSAIGGNGPLSAVWTVQGIDVITDSIVPTVTQTYLYTVTDACGNVSVDSKIIAVTKLDSISHNMSTCSVNNTFDITGNIYFSSAPTAGSLEVSLSNGVSVSFAAPFSSPLTYSFNNLSADGDSLSIVANFSEFSCFTSTEFVGHAVPVVSAIPPITICFGDSVLLQASGASSYLWSTGEVLPNITFQPSTDTTISLTSYNAMLCSSQQFIPITVTPLPSLVASAGLEICQGEQEPTIAFTGQGSFSATDLLLTYSINGGAMQSIVGDGVGNFAFSVPTIDAMTYVYQAHSLMDTSTGCSIAIELPIEILINPRPFATISGSATVCQDGAYPVIDFNYANYTSPLQIEYFVNNGVLQQTFATSVEHPTEDIGVYEYALVQAIDTATGCFSEFNEVVVLTVVERPTATISSSVVVCQNDTDYPQVIFSAAQGQAPYVWTYTVNGNTAQTISSPSDSAVINFGTNIPGEYVVNLTSVNEGGTMACQSDVFAQSTVTIHPQPEVSAGAPTVICEEGQIIPMATGAATYVWSDNLTNGEVHFPEASTAYTVVGIDTNGCMDTATLIVTVVPTPQIAVDGLNLIGCEFLEPTFINNSTGNLTNCLWTLSNGQTFNSCATITPTFSGLGCFDMTLFVSTPEGCHNEMTFDSIVCLYPNPKADFTVNPFELTTSSPSAEMNNHSYNAVSYLWDFGYGGATSIEFEPTYNYPDFPGEFYMVSLEATSEHGCTDIKTHYLYMRDEIPVFVPNAFTPNGDEMNGIFKAVVGVSYPLYDFTLQVFNRWGVVIFETNDVNHGWDGKVYPSGENSAVDLYTWKVEVQATIKGLRRTFYGNVNLLR